MIEIIFVTGCLTISIAIVCGIVWLAGYIDSNSDWRGKPVKENGDESEEHY